MIKIINKLNFIFVCFLQYIRDLAAAIQVEILKKDPLTFESRFESGNLRKAIQVNLSLISLTYIKIYIGRDNRFLNHCFTSIQQTICQKKKMILITNQTSNYL